MVNEKAAMTEAMQVSAEHRRLFRAFSAASGPSLRYFLESRSAMADVKTKEEIKDWLAVRKAEALKIDPVTAEVDWHYGLTLDPYGVHPELPEECRQIGREYFARRPGGDVWVSFCDLPDKTRDALWEMHRHKLAFPAGLSICCCGE
jgi:hypothetical protein